MPVASASTNNAHQKTTAERFDRGARIISNLYGRTRAAHYCPTARVLKLEPATRKPDRLDR
jgi:hypothetical protein